MEHALQVRRRIQPSMIRRNRALRILLYLSFFPLVLCGSSSAEAPEGVSEQAPEQEKPQKPDSEKPDAPVPADSITKSPTTQQAYLPISGEKRVSWFFVRSVGPESLLAGLFTAGIGTARNKPEEYQPHFAGFAKRYGMRFTGVATSNAMEAGFGAVWGEDPRYFRAEGQSFGRRIRNVMVMTVAARRRDGHLEPAYARYIAIPGNNFLSNTWRADSEATTNAALTRTLWGFVARMADNAYQEFWPSVKHKILPGSVANHTPF